MSTVDPNALIWLAIALINIVPATVAAIFSIRASSAAKRSEDLTHQIKSATDGMKDALVKSTSEAALAEGREIGRAEGVTKAAVLAEGRLAAQEKPSP